MVNSVINEVNEKASIIEEVVNKLVSNYCKPLDDFMTMIKEVLNDKANPPTDEELEAMALKLPNLLYFTGEAVESLGIKGDVAEQVKMDLYNSIHLSTSGTMADKHAMAAQGTQSQELVKISYERAYKKIKLRMEASYEMLASVKKVLSRRLMELQLTFQSHGGKSYE
jgi:hypothetical protein